VIASLVHFSARRSWYSRVFSPSLAPLTLTDQWRPAASIVEEDFAPLLQQRRPASADAMKLSLALTCRPTRGALLSLGGSMRNLCAEKSLHIARHPSGRCRA
jgi:hypothetical protein